MALASFAAQLMYLETILFIVALPKEPRQVKLMLLSLNIFCNDNLPMQVHLYLLSFSTTDVGIFKRFACVNKP